MAIYAGFNALVSHLVGRRIAVYRAAVTATPAYATLRMAIDPAATPRVLSGQRAVEAIIGLPARVYLDGGDVCVEVARIRPRVRVAALPCYIGTGTRGERVVIDMARRHAIVGGMTDSGKSVLLRRLALELARGGARLALVDLDIGTWRGFEAVAALAYAVADNSIAAGRLVRRVAADMRDRPVDAWPPLVVIIDEVADLDAADLSALADIYRLGRKRHVTVIAATQYVRGDILDRRMTGQGAVRVAGRVADRTASRLVLLADGAEELAGQGDMLVNVGGRIVRVYVDMPADADIATLPQADTAPAAAVLDDDADTTARPVHPGHVRADDTAILAAVAPGTSARAIRAAHGIGMDRARRIRDARAYHLTPLPAASAGGA